MRIAAHRSTTLTSAAEPETSSKPAGASFLEVLAGASVQSSNGDAASGLSLVQGRDSDSGDQNSQPDSATKPQGQAKGKANPAQDAATQIAPQSNIAQASTPQQTQSNGSAVDRTNEPRTTDRQEKTPANSATPVAIGVLPVPALPVAIVPVTTLPVPSPSDSAQSGNNAGAQKDPLPVGLVEAQTQSESVRTDRVTHATENGQDAAGTPDAKTASASSESSDNALIDSGSTQSDSTACATGFSLPAGITPVALPLSSTTLSSTDFLPSLSDANQLTANTAQTGKVSAAGTAKATPANGTNQTASSTGQSSTGSTSAPAHGVSNATQSASAAQHAQNQAAPATQPAGQSSAQGQATSAASQLQATTAHSAAHEAAASHGRTDGSAEATRTGERPAEFDANGTTGTAGINTANVIQKMNGTEMRVGMHSAEFGEVSIRTSVSQQQMTAQISVDDGDLGKAISAHIPAMEAKLGGEFGLRAVVQVSQSGMSFTGERDSSPQRQQASYARPEQVAGIPAFAEPDTTPTRIASVPGNEYRLDIRA